MMTKYTIIIDEDGAKTLKRQNSDGSVSFIPDDPANSDYQRYLNPEAEDFTPSVIDEA